MDWNEDELDIKISRLHDAKAQMDFKYHLSLIELQRVRDQKQGGEPEEDAKVLDMLQNSRLVAYNRIDLKLYARIVSDAELRKRVTQVEDLIEYYAAYFTAIFDDGHDTPKPVPDLAFPGKYRIIKKHLETPQMQAFVKEYKKEHFGVCYFASPNEDEASGTLSRTSIEHDFFVFLFTKVGKTYTEDPFWTMLLNHYNFYRYPFGRPTCETERVYLASDL